MGWVFEALLQNFCARGAYAKPFLIVARTTVSGITQDLLQWACNVLTV